MPTTPNYSWDAPSVGADTDTWGTKLNTVLTEIDADLKAVSDVADAALAPSNNLSDIASASTARTNLGLAIGTNVQAYDAGLTSIAGLTTVADRMIYTTASDTYAVATLTSFGRSLIDDTSASAARTTLGLGTVATYAIGTSGGTVPLLNGINSWSNQQTFAAPPLIGAENTMRIASGTALDSGKVSFGTSAPGTLALGEIYLQHEA